MRNKIIGGLVALAGLTGCHVSSSYVSIDNSKESTVYIQIPSQNTAIIDTNEGMLTLIDDTLNNQHGPSVEYAANEQGPIDLSEPSTYARLNGLFKEVQQYHLSRKDEQ